jgi:hypothetical protein
MAVNGRRKGSAFERKVAGMVVAAFAPFGVTSKDCYRTPLSGGHVHANQTDPGDLVLSPRLREYFCYSVECKSYRQLDWHKLLGGGMVGGHWSLWWQQACRAAGDVSPLLVFRQNGSKIMCMYRYEDGPKLFPRICTRVATQYNSDRVRVVDFEAFLAYLVKSSHGAKHKAA